jgi:hypothetical protein
MSSEGWEVEGPKKKYKLLKCQLRKTIKDRNKLEIHSTTRNNHKNVFEKFKRYQKKISKNVKSKSILHNNM